MDQIVDNYFFDINFLNYYDDDVPTNGYKVSEKEEVMLCRGQVLLKVSYLESLNLENLVKQKDTLTEDNITLGKVKFQINGETILHIFALDEKNLSLILNFLQENYKRYLSII